MEQIKDICEYKELIRWNKSRFDSVNTNCMVLSDIITTYITENRLFREIYQDGLALFVDEGRYFNLYYFWKKNTPFGMFRQSKPVLVEELNNNGSRDTYIAQIEQALFDSGFRLIRNNLQVEKRNTTEIPDATAIDCNHLDVLKQDGLSLEYCKDEKTMQQVVSLWEKYLSITDIPASHFTCSADNIVLNIVTDSGMVAATHFWKVNGKSSECRHTVTHPDYYKKGLATLLLQTWICHSSAQGVGRWTTWISDQNTKSLGLYQKAGFCINGRTSKQYILNKE